MDNMDIAILNELRNNGRISNLELARRVNLSPSSVLERVRKLRENGVIKGFQSRYDCIRLGYGVTVLIELRVMKNTESHNSIGRQLMKMDEIIEIYDVAGECDYVLKAMTENSESLGKLLARIGRLPGILSSRTTLIIGTLKEETAPRLRPI